MFGRVMHNFRLLARSADFWVAVVAAVVYSSWPLGFLLNPRVAAQDFASQLESRHQPYNWVFIALDILTGLLLCWLGVRQWRATRRYPLLRFSVLCYVLFGLFVIMAAIAPDDCSTSSTACHVALYDPLVVIHGFASIVSVGLLLIGLLLPIVLLWKKHRYDWIMLLVLFVLVSWGLTGIGTLVVMARGMRSNWLQYDFITVCSVSIVVCMAIVARLTAKPARRRSAR